MSSDTSGKPTITGLVLTYNGERLLGKCLESLAFCDLSLIHICALHSRLHSGGDIAVADT